MPFVSEKVKFYAIYKDKADSLRLIKIFKTRTNLNTNSLKFIDKKSEDRYKIVAYPHFIILNKRKVIFNGNLMVFHLYNYNYAIGLIKLKSTLF